MKKWAIAAACLLGCAALLYLVGLFAQFFEHYASWQASGGMGGGRMQALDFSFRAAYAHTFTGRGAAALAGMVCVGGAVFAFVKLHDRFGGRERDERGFSKSRGGTYGTAGWMGEREMREKLKLTSPEQAKGVIFGECKGEVVCLPEDTTLNKNVAVFGASGTMKSRAIIRNALFQALKDGASVVVTDPKGELYADTAQLYRANGYDVKIYNLVQPQHSDSWNCMADLGGDTLMAQVLVNVIIGNTSSAKGDHFWDNGEGNLLKALVLYVALDKTRKPQEKNLPAVYRMLVQNSEQRLTAAFEKLPLDHPARAPFHLFAQASDTVRAGIVLGLGTRLQVLQNKSVQGITEYAEMDLSLPAQKKCAYFIVLSDQDTTLAFLSSLFFSFLFIKLTRYADSRPNLKCDVPVHIILDEFNNIGRIGGAEDGSDFARSLSVCRSRDIRVMLAVQSLGQLQNRYANNLWAEIIGNCDTQLMLGCTDDVTAKYFSERSGEMSVQVESTMTMRKTIAIAQIIPQYRHTEGQGKRRLLTPDEVLRLPHEELLCVLRGCNLFKLKKFDYTRHPYAAKMVKTSVQAYLPIRESAQEKACPQEKPKTKLYAAARPPGDF